MKSLNKIELIGYIGRDIEINMYNAKQAKTSLATSYKGKKEEIVTWHNIVFWDKMADIAEQYLKKGSLIYIEGRQEHNKTEKGGYYSQVIVNNLIMLDGKSEKTPTNEEPVIINNTKDDDIPF